MTFVDEGLRLTSEFWVAFWNPHSRYFSAQRPSAETVPPSNGYLLWPSIIAIEALVEAERASPGNYREQLKAGMQSIEIFYSKQYGAYTAWHKFHGNNDIYYDDNAQVAIAQIAAFELTHDPEYYSRAKRVVDFLMDGWDDSQNPGGMPWHFNSPDSRNTCSTSLTAIALLRLAQVSREKSKYLVLAQKATDWVISRLKNNEGLIMDGIEKENGTWKVNNTTWTYNTGSTLTALSLLYQFHPSTETLISAFGLASAAIDRSKSLYDRSVSDTDVRYWWDSTFFVQLLVEGLLTFLGVFGQPQLGNQQVSPALSETIRNEIKREMRYMIDYIKDQHDGLYFRNFRLYVIGHTQLVEYRSLVNDSTRQLSPDASERVNGDGPIEKRPLVKTLLGNAGAARALLLAEKA